MSPLLDHPLHNFIANGVLVHNKSLVLQCALPDAGMVRGGDVCRCENGSQGVFHCDRMQQPARCEFCEPVGSNDGGTSDAGP